MKSAISITRVILFMIFSFFLLEWIVESGNEWAIVKYPAIWGVLAILLFLAIVFEIILAGIQRVLFATLDSEAQAYYVSEEAGNNNWFKKTYIKLLGAKPIEQEQEIVLDHNYDGIRELDNDLPPWWKYMFYISIVFAIFYMLKYHVFDGTSQVEEYEMEVAQAKADIEEYKKNNKDLIDAESVELLSDAKDLEAGRAIYMDNCIACHKDNGGGGIGPNLTDDYWILGGGIKNVYHTISEGGRPGKGMVAWKTELKPFEMAQVASYVISLHGTDPADAKAPEGDLWTE